MRHPFWRWTGWLSIGLTGCLHGQDWRAAVTKPTMRPVAERLEGRPIPKVVGPFRSGTPKFAPPERVAIPPATVSRPAVPNTVQPTRNEVTPIPVAAPDQQIRNTVVTPVVHENPPLAQPSASAAIFEAQRTGPFAEFVRTIPSRRTDVSNRSVPKEVPVDPQEDAVEVVVVEGRKPAKSIALPVIIPAGAVVSEQPQVRQDSNSETLEPEALASDDQPKGLFSKSAVLRKELPDVTEAKTVTARELSGDEVALTVGAQEVSALVEQVFEDLRQRRLNDARQRTEWLKQLVLKRSPTQSESVVEQETSVDVSEEGSVEPRRLKVDSQATAVEKKSLETFYDDEKSTSGQ